MSFNDVLKEKGFELPPVPEEGGSYVSMKEFGENLLYVSGSCADVLDDQPRGKLGKEVSVEDGKKYARTTMLNILALIQDRYQTLDVIRSFVKLLVFVASEDGFYDQPAVANGATDFLIEVFGEETGKPARSAVGVYSLPDNLPVEIECIIELNRHERI